MADEKDVGSGCVTFCCSHCDEKLESKDALQQHMNTCKMTCETSWIKKEFGEEVSCGGVHENIIQSPEKSTFSVNASQKQITSSTYVFSTQANISSCEIKTEPCPVLPNLENCEQLTPNFLSPLLTPNQLVLSQPQTSKPLPVQVPNVALPQQVPQVRFPVQLTVSPKYHEANKNLTAFEKLQQRVRKKKTVSPSPKIIRNILPKAPVPSEGIVGNSNTDVPKIEKVYYTSKSCCNLVGEIKVAVDAFHPPPLSEEFNLVHSKDKQVKNCNTVHSLESPNKGEPPNVSASNAELQKKMPQVLLSSQGLQYVTQKVQQMPTALVHAPLTLAPAPQSMLPSSQTVFQNQQGILQNNPSLLQQLLQQNLVLVQPASGNVLHNPLTSKKELTSPFVPLLTPQQLGTQPTPSGINIQPTHSSSVHLPTSSTVTTIPPLIPSEVFSASSVVTTDKLSQKKFFPASSAVTTDELSQQNMVGSNKIIFSSLTCSVQSTVAESKPLLSAPISIQSTVAESKPLLSSPISIQSIIAEPEPLLSAPMPVISAPKVIGVINQPYSPLQNQNATSTPASTGFVWLQGTSNPDGCQHIGQFQPPVTSSPLLVAGTGLSSAVGINTVQQQTGHAVSPTNAGIMLLPTSVPSNAIQNSGLLQFGAEQNKLTAAAPGGVNLPVNVANLIKQNQPSNIVLLPPIVSQGYILNGIRIEGPQTPLSTTMSNAQKHAASGTGQSSGIVSYPTDTLQKKSLLKSPSASPASDRESHITGLFSAQKKRNSTHKHFVPEPPVQHPEASSTKADVSETAEKTDAPFLALKFKVEGSVDHHTAAKVRMLLEYKVAQIAKMIVSGSISEHCPVVLDDGRPFLPLTYAGPYISKNTKRFVKRKGSAVSWMNSSEEVFFSNMTKRYDTSGGCVDSAKESRNSKCTIQTIKMPGKIVWLFLDFDGPKILWKLDGTGQHVLALPVEQNLPDKVLDEILMLKTKFKLSIPPSINPLSITAKQTLLPTENTESKQSNSSWQLLNSGSQMEDTGVLKSTQQDEAAASSKSFLESELRSQKSTNVGPTSAAFKQIASVSSSRKVAQCRQQQGVQPSVQLIVREKPDVVKRALKAVVRLHRIPLTDSLLQQVKNSSEIKESSTESQSLRSDRKTLAVERQNIKMLLKRRGRRPNWLKKLLGRISASPDDLNGQGFSAPSKVCKHNQIEDLTEEDLLKFRKKRQSHRNQVTELKETDIVACEGKQNAINSDLVEENAPDRYKAGDLAEQKLHTSSENSGENQEGQEVKSMQMLQEKSRKRKKEHQSNILVKSAAEESECVSGVYSDIGACRSYRIVWKPKPACRLQAGKYSMKERALLKSEQGQGTSRATKKRIGYKSMAEPKLGYKSPLKSRDFKSCEKVSTSDIYLHKAESIEKNGKTGHLQIDNDHENMVKNEVDEDNDSLTADQFLQRHADDFKELILKKAKTNEGLESGMKGHILYLCMICGSFQSRSMDELVVHLKQHYSGELNCQMCSFRAAYKQELIEHEALEHTGKPLYHCEVCQTPFFSRAIFQSHVKRHEASTSCRVCTVNFPSEQALSLHLEKEHSKKFVCCLCYKEFQSEDQVRSHYKHCTDGYQCCLCYIKKTTPSDIQSHIKEDHGHQGTVNFCNFECCGACFLTMEELGSHTAVHLTTI